MSKNKPNKSRKHAEPTRDEAERKIDETQQPENINIDIDDDPDNNESADKQENESDTCPQPAKLSFGEKIASIFAPVRQLKEEAAAAAARADVAKKKVSELTDELAEKEQRITGLQQNLAEAEAKQREAETAKDRFDTDIKKLNDELTEMSALVDRLKTETFAEAAKSFPAELQGRFKSYQDMVATVAAYDKAPAAPAQPATRSLDEALKDPSQIEKDALLRYALVQMAKDKVVPANCTNWRVAVDLIRRKDIEIETLGNKLKDIEKIDHEANLAGSFEDDTLSPRISDAVAPWLQRRINTLIDNEDRRLDAVGDLEARLREIADAVNRPGSHDEAVADGVRSVLAPVSEHLGRDVTVDSLAEALSQYFDERLRHDVMTRFTEATDEERRSLANLVEAANKAMADRAKIDSLLKKLATDRIEQIYERAIAYNFEDVVKRNKPETSSEAVAEVTEAFARDNSFDALIRHLVKAVSTVERRRAKAQSDADIAGAEVERLGKQVEAGAEERKALIKAHDEAMDSLRDEHKTELLKNDELHKAELEKQKATLESAHAAVKASLEEGIARRDADIRGLFDAYLGSVKQSLQTLADDVDAAYTGNRDDNGVADVIDHNIIDNDIYGLEEFRANLLAKLDSVSVLTADAIRSAVRDAFTDILKIESATWIDNLARLALYSQVPFIAAEFMASGVRIDRFAAAFAAMEAVLAQGGITLQLPKLFVDRFDESRHNAEAIKNITSIVSDVASHVPDESTVIDLFTVGYSLDGAEVRKPTVSRINS